MRGQVIRDGDGDGDVPAHLVDVVTAQLVPPVDPVLSVRTIR
ncbi:MULTISPECIES: hypothetical protein [Streptomyces]|nr:MULTISPECIES: hypothetical protein [Streptomyces]WCL83421.1 hypothetical protein PPN52_01625 [Streptomyces sp. JCM 35825]